MRYYEHGGDIYSNEGIEIDFSVNLNPLGMPGEVRRVLWEHFDEFSRYPDRDCRRLRDAISAREDVSAEHILCGNGAADLIYRLCFGLRPRTVLVCAPTFSEYARAAALAGATIRSHRLAEEEGFAVTGRISRELAERPDVVFLCNPNNPTGRLIPGAVLEEIAENSEKQGAILVIDECFLDFTAGVSAKQWMSKFQKMVILKAFTKNYAMAGLRLGYLMTRDPAAMTAAREYAQPWSVSAPAQAAGIAALAAAGQLGAAKELIERERFFLADSLGRLGMKVYPGEANFLLFKSERPLWAPLIQKGILIRCCADYEGLDDRFARICVRTREENERLIAAVQEVLHGESVDGSGNDVERWQDADHRGSLPRF